MSVFYCVIFFLLVQFVNYTFYVVILVPLTVLITFLNLYLICAQESDQTFAQK